MTTTSLDGRSRFLTKTDRQDEKGPLFNNLTLKSLRVFWIDAHNQLGIKVS